MEILSSNDGLMTNIEVLELIKERRQHQVAKVTVELQNKESVEIEALNYLTSTPSGLYSSELVRNCLIKIKALGLEITEAEILQIANHIPTQQVEIHLIIEECPERFDEDQVNNIIGIIRESFGIAAPEELGQEEA